MPALYNQGTQCNMAAGESYLINQGGNPRISVSSAGAVSITAAANQNISLTASGTGVITTSPSVGATTFTALTDVPSTYIGNANKVPNVNSGQTALEYRGLQVGTMGGANATALGPSSVATGINSVVIGNGASAAANAPNAVVIGTSAASTGTNGIVIGNSSTAPGDLTINVGPNSTTSGNNSINVGGTSTSSNGSINIGSNSTTNGGSAISIGNGISNSGTLNVAIGNAAASTGSNNVLVGGGAAAGALSDCVLLGSSTLAQSARQIVIGSGATGPSSQTNLMIVGSSGNPIRKTYIGSGFGALSVGMISEAAAVPNNATTYAFTNFTDNSGALTVQAKGTGNGTTASNAMATFHICKKAGAAAVAFRTVSITGGAGEQLDLEWLDTAGLKIKFDTNVSGTYAGTSTVDVLISYPV